MPVDWAGSVAPFGAGEVTGGPPASAISLGAAELVEVRYLKWL
ncbi:hypothetical protein [Candidatus Dormiibacter inghamiae]